MQDFILFIRQQGVVGFAIGFILGGAVSKLVTSFVSDIIQPTLNLIFGSTEGLKTMTVGGLRYGNFAATLIDFIVITAVVFFIFKRLRLDRLDIKKIT